MRTSFKGALTALAAVGAAAVAPAAWACGPASYAPADWSGDGAQLLTPVNLGAPSIVGMWAVQFIDGGTGAQTDFGFTQWHADGTEFMNSAGHNPALQNYCIGVWAQTGPFSYHLTHYAEAYNPAGEGTPNGTLAVTLRITEDVTVDGRASSYSGHFSIDVVDSQTLAPVAGGHVQDGTVKGRRVTP